MPNPYDTHLQRLYEILRRTRRRANQIGLSDSTKNGKAAIAEARKDESALLIAIRELEEARERRAGA